MKSFVFAMREQWRVDEERCSGALCNDNVEQSDDERRSRGSVVLCEGINETERAT